MLCELTYSTRVLSIVADILKVRATQVGLGDLAVVENSKSAEYEDLLKQIHALERDAVGRGAEAAGGSLVAD